MPVLFRPLQERFTADVAERYRVERELGRGASAVVYLAHDRKHGREVALKVLDPVTAPASGAARFHQEIALLAGLQHPHILPLHDSGEAAGSLYFVTPYVSGESLRARLKRQGTLPPGDALRVACEVANALAYAHARGVVHRDVKPENVLLTADLASGGAAGAAPNGAPDGAPGGPPGGRPRAAPGRAAPGASLGAADWHAVVCDFGIARLTRRDAAAPADAGHTDVGGVVGTLAYMAPEQAQGDPEVDARADVWALGLVLYEMLAGRLPHADAPTATLARVRRYAGPPPAVALAGVPREALRRLDALFARALAPDPGARFATARELAAAIGGVQAAMAAPGVLGSRRARWGAALAAAALVAAGAAGTAAIRAGQAGGAADGAVGGVADGAALDTSLVVVLPFADERGGAPTGAAGPPAGAVDGREAERLLLGAFARWTDLRLVNATRVNDELARAAGADGRPRAPATLTEALAAARRLGAGRLAWGAVARVPGAPGRTGVRAALYDVARPDGALREYAVATGADLGEVDARFAELADSLLLGTAHGRVSADGAVGTRSWRAWHAYDRGHEALARWDLGGAAAAFGEAAERDPDYALAARWLAQSYAWMVDPPAAAWRQAAARAAALAGRMPAADAAAARALAALAEGRYPEACAGYQRLLARDTTDYAAWYGLGDCHARDSLVVRDAASPSGWRFRSSYRAAQAAYGRVLQGVPSVHRAFGGAAVTYLPRLLVANRNQLRIGRAVLGADTLVFGAYPSLVDDTLAFVPWPMADFAAVRLRTIAGTRGAAIARNRALLLDVAERWASAFPRSADVAALRAFALESVGRLDADAGGRPGALGEVRRARALAADPVTRQRLVLAEARVLLKLSRFADARALADSLIAAAPAQPRPALAGGLAIAAALTGRVYRTDALLRAASTAPNAAPPWASGLSVAAANGLAAYTAYAALAAPRDSVEQARVRLVAALAPAARGAVLWPVAVLAFPSLGASALDGMAVKGYYMLEMQAAVARGDSAELRRRFQAVSASRRGGDVQLAPDAAVGEAWLHAWAGDTAAARGALDALLDNLPSQSTTILDDVPRAAAIGRALSMACALARQAGERDGGRWAPAASALWRHADPAVVAAASTLPRR